MICKNCGKDLPDNAVFCTACGFTVSETQQEAPVSTEQPSFTAPVSEPTPASSAVYNSFEAPYQSVQPVVYETPKKFFSKKKVIVMVAVFCVAILGIAGVLCRAQIGNFVMKTFASDESYYKYIEEKNRDTSLERLETSYTDIYEKLTQDTCQKTDVTITLGDTLKAMISLAGYDISSLDSIGFSGTASRQGSQYGADMSLNINGIGAMTFNTFIDISASTAYMQVPELTTSYLDASSVFDMIDESLAEEQLSISSLLDSISNAAMTPETVNLLYTRYTDILFRHYTQITQSDSALTAGNTSNEYTALTVTYDGIAGADLIDELLVTLRDDAEIKAALSTISPEFEASFTEAIVEVYSDFTSDRPTVKAEDLDATMILYIDASGKIVGRSISYTNKAGENYGLSWAMPRNGSAFGYQFALTSNGAAIMDITGNGTIESDILTGDFTASVTQQSVELDSDDAFAQAFSSSVQIHVSELDTKACQAGQLNGTFTITVPEIVEVKDYALSITADATDDTTNYTIEVSYLGTKMGTIEISNTYNAAAPTATAPSASDVVYDLMDEYGLMAYMSEINLDAFLLSLQTKCNIDLTTIIQTIMINGMDF